MRPDDRNGIAVMISVILASFTVRAADLRQQLPRRSAGSLIIMIGAVSIALRRARMSSTVGARHPGGDPGRLLRRAQPVDAHARPKRWSSRGSSTIPHLWADGIEHMRTQASPMEPNDGVTLDLRHGHLPDHDHDRSAGLRRAPAGLVHRASGDAVPGARARPGHRYGRVQLPADRPRLSRASWSPDGLNTTARWTRGLSRDSAERIRRGHAGGLASGGLPRHTRRSWSPSCSGSRCRPCHCRDSASATAPAATARCS